jgi:hypothetical protein
VAVERASHSRIIGSDGLPPDVSAVATRRRPPRGLFPIGFIPEAQQTAIGDLYWFATEVLGKTLLEPSPHRELAGFIQTPSTTRHRMVFMPRGTMKTTVVTECQSLWRIIRDPNERILLYSDLRETAKKFATPIRRSLEAHPRFRQLFGSLEGPTWTETGFTVTRSMDFREPTVMPAGIDVNVVGLHFRRIIADDLVGRQTVTTKEAITKTMETIDLLEPLLELPENDPLVELTLVGTFWDDLDPYWQILRQSGLDDAAIRTRLCEGESVIGEWEVFFRGAYLDAQGKPLIGETSPRTLCASLSIDTLERRRRRMDPYLFAANYLMDPVPAGSAVFRKEFIRRWAPPLADDLIVIMFLDPAISTARRSSYSAIVIVAIDPMAPDQAVRILTAWHDRVNETHLAERVVDLYQTYLPQIWGIESVIFQKILRYPIMAAAARAGVSLPPPREVPPSTRTTWEARVRGLLLPLYEGGRMYHPPTGAPDLEMELVRFPRGTATDLIDGLAGCIELLPPPNPVLFASTARPQTYQAPENPYTAY